MYRPHCSPLRCLITWAVATGLAVALMHLLLTDLLSPNPGGPVSFATTLAMLCEGVLLGCIAWAWLATAAVVVEALLAGSSRDLVRPGIVGVPLAWRRLVLLACGVTLAVGVAVPAQATPGAVQVSASGGVYDGANAGAGGDAAMRGLPLPDRATDHHRTSATVPVAPTQPTRAPLRPDVTASPRTALVGPGDTLWAIARADLGHGERWREIFALNRDVLGTDPDLIIPGQRLTLPSSHHR